MFEFIESNNINNQLFNFINSLRNFILRKNIKVDSFVVLHLAARYLIMEYDRILIPDWVEKLALAKIDDWRDALNQVRMNLLDNEEEE